MLNEAVNKLHIVHRDGKKGEEYWSSLSYVLSRSSSIQELRRLTTLAQSCCANSSERLQDDLHQLTDIKEYGNLIS